MRTSVGGLDWAEKVWTVGISHRHGLIFWLVLIYLANNSVLQIQAYCSTAACFKTKEMTLFCHATTTFLLIYGALNQDQVILVSACLSQEDYAACTVVYFSPGTHAAFCHIWTSIAENSYLPETNQGTTSYRQLGKVWRIGNNESIYS